MNLAYLLLGSDLGDREDYLDRAREMIAASAGNIIAKSSVYESEPWGFESEKLFLNQALLIQTPRSPVALLNVLKSIEHSLGRTRPAGQAYASRTIDIDILFFNDRIVRLRSLEIPHPRIGDRLFTLLPLDEIARELVHPLLRKTVGQLRKECADTGNVRLFEPQHQDNQIQ